MNRLLTGLLMAAALHGQSFDAARRSSTWRADPPRPPLAMSSAPCCERCCESRDLRVIELTGTPKIQPLGNESASAQFGGGRFRGTMRQLAELLSMQLSVIPSLDPSTPAVASRTGTPVLDETGAAGVYEFEVTMDPGAQPLAMWQRILREQLGLTLETWKSAVEVLVIDSADRVPVEN